jgi:hypothetical protein
MRIKWTDGTTTQLTLDLHPGVLPTAAGCEELARQCHHIATSMHTADDDGRLLTLLGD